MFLQKLGYLALAIVQAGAYICKTGCSLSQYLEMYGERRAMFLEEYRNHVQKIDNYEWTVYTTWTVSFERLSQPASTFLNICAFLHHDGISTSIFQNATHNITTYELYDSQRSSAVKKAKDFLDSFRNEDGIWDLHKFLSITTEARSYSLIDLDERNNLYSVHPLVHSWTRSRVSDETTFQACSQYILGMSINWRFETDDLRFRRMILHHVDTSLRGGAVPDMAVRLALVYTEGGQPKKAEKLCVQGVEVLTRTLGEEHPVTLARMSHLARTYMDQCRWKEAEELLMKMVEAEKRLFGEEHREALTSTGDLALTYLNQGRLKEAEELGVKVVEKKMKVFGEEHSATLVSMENLALTYLKQGRLSEAEELGAKTMEMSKRVLGEEHPDTLTSMANLAVTYLHQGQYSEAEEHGTKAMEMRNRVLGEEHPATLTSMSNLATIYWHQGRFQEAEKLVVKVVEGRKRVLGEDHPETSLSLLDLTAAHDSQVNSQVKQRGRLSTWLGKGTRLFGRNT
jgi:tetratricopeptide (TPR) repeat protein